MSPDLSTSVGSVSLANPVMTASGTSGHGAELGAYGPLDELGAVVVKSLAVMPWPGNPPPRVHGAGSGMLNSVGLQGPGVEAWLHEDLPALVAAGATVVASIWGRSAEEFAKAAALLAGVDGITALEVNVSCPNLAGHIIAQSPAATAEAVDAASGARLPRWAKLSPNVADVVEVAGAALGAGAETLTLVNTLLGMVIDAETGRPMAGGLSGPPLHPVAVRAVYDCRAAFADAGIVGVGGVATAADAVELLRAGADAVQVGTATFRDPRAPWKVLRGLRRYGPVRSLVGTAHGRADGGLR